MYLPFISSSIHVYYPSLPIALSFPTILSTHTSPAHFTRMTTTYAQQQLTLPSLGRGSHLITPHIISSLSSPSATAPISDIKHGLLHLFLQHTSCALTLNENWDEAVRADMSDALDGIAPEDTVRCPKPFRIRESVFLGGISGEWCVEED